MFKFIEDWQTRRRIKTFLKINPGYLLSDEQIERRDFLRDNPGYIGPGTIEEVGHELDIVERLDPILTPQTPEAFYAQLDSGEPWTWDQVKRSKTINVVTEITT